MLLNSSTSFWGLTALAWGFVALGCGSRSALRDAPEENVISQCSDSSDCVTGDLCFPLICQAGACIAGEAIVCTSSELCSDARCEPSTGACELIPRTPDLDGDGYRSPLPGFEPGEEGACGLDCDDTSRLAFPGGVEVCDGVDNDCDGIIDNGEEYLSLLPGEIPEVRKVADAGFDGSARRGAAFGEGVYALGYWGRSDLTRSYVRGVNAAGDDIFPQTAVANVNAPSFGVDLVWSGADFGATWSDPRVDENYEVYFARFSPSGEKLGPDLRLSDAPDFSIHSRVFYDQGRYVVIWDDRRFEAESGGPALYAQFITELGEVVGENIPISDESEIAEYPSLAATASRFGVVYTALEGQSVGLRFRSYDKEFSELGEFTELVEADARAPRISAVADRFVVTWDEYGDAPGESIWGAVLSERGEILIGPTPLSSGATFARSHDTISLGDRFVLLWVDDKDGNYELYAKVLDASLSELEGRVRITDDDADTLRPHAVLGDAGRIGLLFDDWRSGTHHTYFTTLGCGEAREVR